jgi:phosphate starvation-inducible protein PhoH and related proteins
MIATGEEERPIRCILSFGSTDALRELVGELGKHLKLIGGVMSVEIAQRGQDLTLLGTREQVESAARLLEQFEAIVSTGYELKSRDVEQAARVLMAEPHTDLVGLYTDTIHVGVGNRGIHPRSLKQRVYVQSIRKNDLVFGVGPAGTGKTYLAMAMALGCLFRNEVKRIIISRPAVEAGEKLGFLPGDMVEKVDPYLRPMYDALYDLVESDRANRLLDKGIIEVAPIAFMRGRTLADAFVILDEAQNTSREQMKMFLTRLGMSSRAVVTGDPSQVDLPRGVKSGLADALRVLSGVQGIEVVRFSTVDVVRHPLVARIIQAYAKMEKQDS